MAKERSEGICYHIAGFTGESKGVGDLAQGMFNAAFYCGSDIKVYFITNELFDSIISNDVARRKSIEDIRSDFEEFKKQSLTDLAMILR
ncbi:MAG: hypothetical protein ACUVQY_08225 [Thermoproteota archaeon]